MREDAASARRSVKGEVGMGMGVGGAGIARRTLPRARVVVEVCEVGVRVGSLRGTVQDVNGGRVRERVGGGGLAGPGAECG